MEDVLYDMQLFQQIACLDTGNERLPDELIIRRVRHLLARHELSVLILETINTALRQRYAPWWMQR